jgi:hypothetical protein
MKGFLTASYYNRFTVALSILIFALLFSNVSLYSTSQWARKTGMNCFTCHTVFPRLNAFGEKFLKNGYQLESEYKKDFKKAYPIDAGGTLLDEISNLFGFRLNMTPIQYETNALKTDSVTAKGKLTLGSPIWLQTFVAGSIYKDISFFGEFEFQSSSFKFNWFYFNFTNLFGTGWLNFQVGNVSPQEFCSYPDRLPQLPALKGQVFKIVSSNKSGDNSIDMSSGKPGITYYGHNDFFTIYAGVTPGKSVSQVNDNLYMYGGIVLSLPESISKDFAGSTLTLHYMGGTDTKGFSTGKPIENKITRISPQFNIRWNNLDIQAAYVIAKDDNWYMTPTKQSLSFNGLAIDAGYFVNEEWHIAVHYDNYSSEKINNVKVLDYQRLVPAITYIINGNYRLTLYFEYDMTKDKPNPVTNKLNENIQKLYLNIRTMF